MPDKSHIVIHHSATDDGDVNSFRKYHVEKLGWRDVGYNWVITKEGEKQKGRDENDTGAHCKGKMNYVGIGICLVGNFEKYPPNEKQMQALKELIGEIRGRWPIPLSNIGIHRQYRPTVCPGKHFPYDELMTELKRAEQGFKDIEGHWAEDEIRQALEMGIVSGVTDSLFKPDREATRAEVTAIVMRALNKILKGE